MWLFAGYIHATLVQVAVAKGQLFVRLGALQLTGKMQQSKTHKACRFPVQLVQK